MSTVNCQEGATLLEVLLVMAIASSMFIMGIQLYQSLQMSLQAGQLQYNVDQLFQAAGNYYQANCAYGGLSPNPLPPNALASLTTPASDGVAYPPKSSVQIPITGTTGLIATGYLTNWYPSNPLVDPSSGNGYVVQFNPVVAAPTIPVNVCPVITPGTPCVPIPGPYGSGTATNPQPTIVTWSIQVAVQINATQNIKALALLLNADCISGLSGSIVNACSSANPANFVVWQRAASMSALSNSSPLLSSLPNLKLFNQQYTHDQNYEINLGYTSTTGPAYYLCGG